MGIIALVWTFDCFVGAYLTFPAQQRKSIKHQQKNNFWLMRWWKAWRIRWKSGFSKINFDLQRAGGL